MDNIKIILSMLLFYLDKYIYFPIFNKIIHYVRIKNIVKELLKYDSIIKYLSVIQA